MSSMCPIMTVNQSNQSGKIGGGGGVIHVSSNDCKPEQSVWYECNRGQFFYEINAGLNMSTFFVVDSRKIPSNNWELDPDYYQK